MPATEAPHTVLVHINVEIAHGTWLDLLETLYGLYIAAEAAEPTGIALLKYDEWVEVTGRELAGNYVGDEVEGALSVGTDAENTPILSEADVCIPLAEEV